MWMDPIQKIEHEITVCWKHRVFFTEDALRGENLLLANLLSEGRTERCRVLFVVDEALARGRPALVPAIRDYCESHARLLDLVRFPMVIEGGERVKNSYSHLSEIHDAINTHHIDRQSAVVAIGGGALLDMAGLAAATAHRGVRHIRLPSTTLSQADSGVGVKNAINAFGKKNFIGTFAPPHSVINDFQLLSALPARDMRCGFVEAVKVACIRDRAFFEDIERNAAALNQLDRDAVRRVIQRCAELHIRHIATSGDPFEFGSARPLDFGHWAAHKLEQLSDYELRHGEAVAIGIALDTLYSRRIGLLSKPEASRILDLLERLGFNLFSAELQRVDADHRLAILTGLQEFKEHLGGQLAITLLEQIGRGAEVHEMHPGVIAECINELEERNQQPSTAILSVRPRPA